MKKLLLFCLMLFPSLLFSQTNYQTIVQIKRDFQENTFEEKDRKFAKEYFDDFCTKIEAKLKSDIATDKTLGIVFDEKNVMAVCQISFYMADEGEPEGRLPYLKISIIDNFNKYEIVWWQYFYLPKNATVFREILEQYNQNIEDSFKYYNLHVLFGKFCSYNQPDLSLQKRHMKKYINIIVLPSAKDSKFQIINNIATNSLISNNYNEYQSARDHLGIFVLS